MFPIEKPIVSTIEVSLVNVDKVIHIIYSSELLCGMYECDELSHHLKYRVALSMESIASNNKICRACSKRAAAIFDLNSMHA